MPTRSTPHTLQQGPALLLPEAAELQSQSATRVRGGGSTWRVNVVDGRIMGCNVLLVVVDQQEDALAVVRADQVVPQVQVAHRQAHLRGRTAWAPQHQPQRARKLMSSAGHVCHPGLAGSLSVMR